jgi:hypothetical protein
MSELSVTQQLVRLCHVLGPYPALLANTLLNTGTAENTLGHPA